MVTVKQFKKMALAFAEAEELPHFDTVSFRVKKKIFVTLNEKENRVCFKLNPIGQEIFCSIDSEMIYQVPNKWGKLGWTLARLKNIDNETLLDAITRSYVNVAPKKIAEVYIQKLKAQEDNF